MNTLKISNGRADYGDATTVAMIDELADMLALAEKLDAMIFRRLKPSQHKGYEECLNVDFGVGKLRKYATDWQERLDAEAAS